MRHLLFIIISIIPAFAFSQDATWTNFYRTYSGMAWRQPIRVSSIVEGAFNDRKSRMDVSVNNGDDTQPVITIPFRHADTDSITFSEPIPQSEEQHCKYRAFPMYITTGNAQSVSSDEWITCHISIDGKADYASYSGTGRIRGRGNSTWEWYDKKPYKIKLDSKSKLLGLGKAKNWNLLANYRDVTDLMNTFAFEVARYMGMPYTNHTRYVEIFLNGDYVGLYQLTEKIEVKSNRVEIDENDGILLAIDRDDGPELSPYSGDNFYSKIFRLPMCLKYPDPDDLSEAQLSAKLAAVKEDFAKVEKAIQAKDYKTLNQLIDMHSFISLLQIHEFLYNVEIDAPRSIYLFKDKGGKYTFGPVWDFDAGYDFDWATMYNGHRFFTSYKELIYGTDPYNAWGAEYYISAFWRNMFNNSTFVKQYKDTWRNISDSLYLAPWKETNNYVTRLNREGAYNRDIKRWPLKTNNTTHSVTTELSKMSSWLKNRKLYLDDIISNYPE